MNSSVAKPLEDIVLHIGTEKTGSTTLQHFLDANQQVLRELDICVPKSVAGNHLWLTAAALDDDKLTDTLRLLYGINDSQSLENFRRDVIDDSFMECVGAKRAILSNEHCSSRLLSYEELSRLHDMLARLTDDIKVVLYLRRQDEFLLSTYSTSVRSGETAHLEIPTEDIIRTRYDYSTLIRRWRDVFGPSVIVRIFDRSTLIEGDIVADFLSVIDVDRHQFVRVPDTNGQLTALQLEFLRRLNEHLPLLEDGQLSPYRFSLAELVDKLPRHGPRLSLPHSDLVPFMERFKEGNGWIADTFFHGRQPSGDPLFGEPRMRGDSSTAVDLTLDQAFQMFSQLWRMLVKN